MNTRVHPVWYNEAEAMLFRFFDENRRHLDLWDLEQETDHSDVTITGMFNCTRWSWGEGEPIAATLSRDVDINLDDFDSINMCIQAGSSTTISVTGVVDGTRCVLIAPVHGNDAGLELEGPIGGSRISRIEIRIEDSAIMPGLVSLFWLGVFDSAARMRMRSRVQPYPEEWWDLLVPESESILDPVPQLGLFFDAGDLSALREKAESPTWGPVTDELRKIAASHLDDEPWKGTGQLWNNYPVRDGRGDGENTDHNWIDWGAMRVCAFIGLLDRDERLLRVALRHALAAAYCDHWNPTQMSTMPGSSWETRAFYHYRNAINIVFAWDWAGAFLTDAGKELLAQAISIKGMSWIHQTLMRHPYVRGNNQGIFFTFGAIVCSAALSKHWKFGGMFIEPAFEALNETVTQYYAADGGTYEGIGYATGSLQQALAAYAVYARHTGQSIHDIVPEVVHRIPDYIRTMLSTAKPYGAIIKTADGGRAGACVQSGSLGLLAYVTGDESISALLSGMNEQPQGAGYPPGPELNINYGPESLPPPAATPPVFHILRQTGMLCSTRSTPSGEVRIQLIGAPANVGHCHEDKGSFVLEAFGEELAADRGQMPYVDPRCTIIKMSRYHNLLIPDDPSGLPLPQINPAPDATIPTGTGDELTLRASMVLDTVWGEIVSRCSRSIESDDPIVSVVVDSIELTVERTVGFHVHSEFPWHRDVRGWYTQGVRGRLYIVPEWDTIDERGEEDFVLGTKEPGYHLALRAGRASKHKLRTRLEVEPVKLG